MAKSGDLRKMLAQSFIVGLEGMEPSAAELEYFSRQGLGGAVLFARNLEPHDPVHAWEFNSLLARTAKEAGQPAPFVMIDQEGGTVARLKTPFTAWPDLARLEAAPGRGPGRPWPPHGGRAGRRRVQLGSGPGG